MIVQMETTLKLRFWGPREEMPDDEAFERWLASEMYVVARKLQQGFIEGELEGPGGQRGHWEIDTHTSEKEGRT